jgi:hypothetical protein
MAYEITAKGKEAIGRYPDDYKRLLSKITKEKPEVMSITGDWNGRPVARVKSYEIGIVRNNMTNIIGYSLKKSEAVKAAKELEKVLVGISRVTVSQDNTIFY